MNEDYVSYELALKLKECGFDEPCDSYYDKACASDDEYWYTKREEAYNWNGLDSDCQISAPSLYAAQKWLREKWGIHVDACIYSDYSTDADGKVCDRWDFWGFDLYAVVGGEKMIDDDGEYDSYECALSAGISAVLELIKKGE